MKTKIFLLAVIGFVGLRTLASAQEIRPQPIPDRWYNHPARETGFQLGLGPSLALLSGTVGYGGDLQFLVQTAADTSIGLQTGVQHWSAQGELLSNESLTVIPVLADFLYHVHVANSAARPFFGLSAGIAVATGNRAIGGVAAGNGTSVFFNGYLRFGIETDLSNTLTFYIDPKVGLLKSRFVFAPTLGFLLNL